MPYYKDEINPGHSPYKANSTSYGIKGERNVYADEPSLFSTKKKRVEMRQSEHYQGNRAKLLEWVKKNKRYPSMMGQCSQEELMMDTIMQEVHFCETNLWRAIMDKYPTNNPLARCPSGESEDYQKNKARLLEWVEENKRCPSSFFNRGPEELEMASIMEDVLYREAALYSQIHNKYPIGKSSRRPDVR